MKLLSQRNQRFFKILDTVRAYFLLIDVTIDLDLGLHIFKDLGKQFKETSLTKVMLSICPDCLWLSKDVKWALIKADLFFGLRQPWLLIMCLLFVWLTWLSQSKIDGWGLMKPAPKCRWKFSHPLVVLLKSPRRQPAQSFGGNLAAGDKYVE